MGAGAASAAPKDCAALNRASMRAAIQMDLYMDLGDSASWNAAYTIWVNIEAALEANGC